MDGGGETHLTPGRRAQRSLRTAVACLIVGISAATAIAEPSELFDDWFSRNRPGLDVLGAESLSAEDDAPRIPEPMVFDLVRPLGAKQGEAEVNVLALIPLNRRVGTTSIPGPIGIVSRNGHETEWAPEVEFALWDGVAFEFEVPFEGSTLAAYKAAAQITFGTAFDKRYIHGAQGILLYDTHSRNWSPTLLYLAGIEFDEHFSMLAMAGFRTEFNNDEVAERTERLLNATLFYHVNEQVTLGFESVFAHSLSGASDLLLMPQVHWEINDYTMLQAGVGVNMNQDYSLPQAGLRFIVSY
ncbi:MAG: hypothetical protein KF774_17255 [Planctomyces sp.]|nr:hypothetical protein [Planctomyces sp.]